MLLEKVPQTIQQKKKQHTGLIHLKPELSSLVNSRHSDKIRIILQQ